MFVHKSVGRISHSLYNRLIIQNVSVINTIQANANTEIIEQSLISNYFLKSNQEFMKNVKVISHRGRSDLFPENTVESISEALVTSDLAEFDVMLTKDNEVIVFHDRFLGQLTNISELAEFKDRKTVNNLNEYGQIPHQQWWVKQFTLQEIKKLRVRQKHATRPQIKEKQFKISTLDQMVKKALQLKSAQQKSNTSGLLLQIKTQRQNFETCARDLILLQKISECLKANNVDSKQNCSKFNLPIIVQTFNHQALKTFHHLSPYLPLVHLYSDQDENVNQEYLVKHRTPQSTGVAISARNLTRQFVEVCRNMKYQVFYWSVVDDHPQIPLGCKSYEEFYLSLKGFNIDGIITDFASNCKNALSVYM